MSKLLDRLRERVIYCTDHPELHPVGSLIRRPVHGLCRVTRHKLVTESEFFTPEMLRRGYYDIYGVRIKEKS